MIKQFYFRIQKLLAISIFIVTLISCKKEYITEQIIISSPEETSNGITRFWFEASDNAAYLNESLELDIAGNIITGRIPYYTNLKSLVPSFETNGNTVLIGEISQESGLSANDFTNELTYKVTGDNGKTQEYVVKLVNFTGLPVIKITTAGNAEITSKEDYVNASISIDGAGKYEDFSGNVRIRGRGNSTWSLPKKPYRLKFDNKESILGMPADKDWALLANYTDKTQVRNETAFFIGRMSNLEWTPQTRFAEIFLNEVYQGTYQICEHLKVSNDRVNVTDNGYLLEVDQLSRMEAGDVYFRTSRILLNIKSPDVEEGDEKYNFIKNYVTNAENVLYGSNFKDSENGYAKYLDVENFVDWYLINEITKNNDAIFFSSCFMNLAPNGKLKMGPIWDFDIAFGNVNYNNNQYPEGFWVKNYLWMNRLFQDPNFVKKVKERFLYFNSNRNIILNYINNSSSSLKWSALENNNKWQTLYTQTWPNYAIWGSYNNEVIYMKNWFNTRMNWLENAFDNL